MERPAILLLLLFAFCAFTASPALARRSNRKLNGGYPKSGSSPTPKAPYSSPPSGSSPTTPTPTPTPTPSIPIPPVTPTPSIPIPPVTPSPTPVVIPPVSSSPTGGYKGYGSRSGQGTSGFFRNAPKAIPRILSLVRSIAKLFGPRLSKFLKGKKPPSVLGALKDTSPLPMSALAREATASLINSYKLSDFPLSTEQVVTQFNAALDSPQLAAQQALKFQQLNEGV